MIDLARLIYIGVVLLGYQERDVWRMTPFKLLRLFHYHKEYNQHLFKQTGAPTTSGMDPIDMALGGM